MFVVYHTLCGVKMLFYVLVMSFSVLPACIRACYVQHCGSSWWFSVWALERF